MPTATAGTSLAIHVGGETAGGIDFSNVLAGKLPLFVVVIVVLAFLLLAAVFRSLLVPLMASVMNILSIGAALGAITAAFQFGWLKPVLGFAQAGPIEVYLPVMMFAVLFGLSMDYEVFLVSRMHEEWIATGDNRKAVTTRSGRDRTGHHRGRAHHDPRLLVRSASSTTLSSDPRSSVSVSPSPSSSTPSSSAPSSCPPSCTSSAGGTGGSPHGSTVCCRPCTSKADRQSHLMGPYSTRAPLRPGRGRSRTAHATPRQRADTLGR